MSNEEFLRRLEGALKNRVPQEDVDDAMNYHREYFAEAGENAAEALPAPEAVAEQIIRERAEYLRKRQFKWARPAVVAALCIGLVVTVAVSWGAKHFFRDLWGRAVRPDTPFAVAEQDVVSQVTEGTYAGTGFVTTETGSRVYVSGTMAAFESIVIEGVSDNVTITAAGEEFRLDIDHDKKENMDCNVLDGTLYISGDLDGMFNMGYEPGNITITVPQDISWRSMVRVDTDMGNIYLENIDAGEVELDTDMGNITVSNGHFNNLDCDSDLGDVTVTSVEADSLKCCCDCGQVNAIEFVANETDLESNLGSVTAIAVGARSDYSLELEVDLGEVKVDGQKVSSPYETYGKSYVLKAKADVGSVTLDFTEASAIPSLPDPPSPPDPPELAEAFH